MQDTIDGNRRHGLKLGFQIRFAFLLVCVISFMSYNNPICNKQGVKMYAPTSIAHFSELNEKDKNTLNFLSLY